LRLKNARKEDEASLVWIRKAERKGKQGELENEKERRTESDRRCGEGRKASVCDEDERWALR
jgi:hypothetical protein